MNTRIRPNMAKKRSTTKTHQTNLLQMTILGLDFLIESMMKQVIKIYALTVEVYTKTRGGVVFQIG